MRALVTGASGYVGSRLVTALLDAGHEVVATARTPGKLAGTGWGERVRTVELDVLDEASTEAAFRVAGRLDVAFYLVHGLGEGDYEASDQRAADVFAAAAARARVGRIVYLGGFVPADDAVSDHLRSREHVGNTLRAGEVDAVVLQAAVVLGAGSTSFEIIRHLVDRLWVVPLPSFMRHEVQPIGVDDVLHYLVAAAEPGLLPPGTYDIAGPDRVSYASLARIYAEVTGLRRIFVPVPFVSVRLAGVVMGPLLPVPNALVADLVQSLGASMTTDDGRIRTLVPDPPAGLTSLRAGITRALAPPAAAERDEVQRLDDPMQLAETDAGWAGRQD